MPKRPPELLGFAPGDRGVVVTDVLADVVARRGNRDCAGAYQWHWRLLVGSRAEVERSGLLGEFNLALSNHDAAKWLDIMRKNPQPGALDRCTSVDTTTTGGKGVFVFAPD
jgi:hypothetical protein